MRVRREPHHTGQPLSPPRRAKAKFGGGRGIRTPGTLPGSVVFKTTAIDHSAIPPRRNTRRNSRNSGARSFTPECPTRSPRLWAKSREVPVGQHVQRSAASLRVLSPSAEMPACTFAIVSPAAIGRNPAAVRPNLGNRTDGAAPNQLKGPLDKGPHQSEGVKLNEAPVERYIVAR